MASETLSILLVTCNYFDMTFSIHKEYGDITEMNKRLKMQYTGE